MYESCRMIFNIYQENEQIVEAHSDTLNKFKECLNCKYFET